MDFETLWILGMVFFLPVSTLIWFIVSLIRFLLTYRKRRRQPGAVSDAQWKKHKSALVESGFVAGAINIGLIVLIAWLVNGIANM